MYDYIPERKGRRQQKMHGFEKNFSWLCQEVKAIDDGGDGSKSG
jgi:hypothetical protein